MAIEKAFAIKGAPDLIWRALTGELEADDDATYTIEQAVPNELLSLRVDLERGVRASITYRLIPQADHTEVVATMTPEGIRYGFYRLFTLGRYDTNCEVLLVQGLANLKQAVEEAPASG